MGYTLADYDIDYTDQTEFSAGDAFEVSGVNQNLQTHWRNRGLLSPIEGRGHARFQIEEVVRMTIMQRLSESGTSIKGLQKFFRTGGTSCNAQADGDAGCSREQGRLRRGSGTRPH